MRRQRSGSRRVQRRQAGHGGRAAADLDITSFMNLMIILVPVLLVSMVFSQTTVLDLSLPALSDLASSDSLDKNVDQSVEVLIFPDHLQINYPAGVAVKTLLAADQGQDYAGLTRTLRAIKQQLAGKGIDKRDIRLLAQPGTDYQTLVYTMDSVRSFAAVVGVEVVQAELFPQISFGDAPLLPDIMANQLAMAGDLQ